MKVIFIHHSCFLVEVDEKVLIFDWFAGDRVSGYQFHGVIPEYEPDTPIYVFSSHKHQDHFDMDVLRWSEKYQNIHYIFSKDCKMTSHFLSKHGIDPQVKEKILYVTGCEKYHISEDMTVETLRSTDAGVAYYVETNGVTIFHAGDLNNWKWEGVGDIINGKMEYGFKSQMKRIENRPLNIAFFPVDPRLSDNQFLGIEYLLKHSNAEYIFPMHMWQDYSGIQNLKKRISNQSMIERIVDISHENQEFIISEE